MANPSDCPFCQKLADPNGWPSTDIVWNFPHSVAVLGPWQYYTGYCLLIARDHATELSQLGVNRSAYLGEMATLAEAIEVCFTPYKLNYELLGNLVPHLHWHIFPRSQSDPERLRPVWMDLAKADVDPAEKQRLEASPLPRNETAARLREWLRIKMKSET